MAAGRGLAILNKGIMDNSMRGVMGNSEKSQSREKVWIPVKLTEINKLNPTRGQNLIAGENA